MNPNIVLICVDQWRGDALGSAGHQVVSTPFLDGLASDGIRFSNAFSATPSCIPARAAMFTGLSQRHHGRVGYRDGVDWNYPTTIAGEFTSAGYQTQAIGKMHVHPARSQLGFQNVTLHDGFLHAARGHGGPVKEIDDYVPWLESTLGRRVDYFDHGVNCNSYVARPWDKPEYTHPTNWATSQAIDFLITRDRRKPFFLFLSYFHPHPPYDPPEWALDQYLRREMPAVIDGESLHRARAGYYGHMTHIDGQVNRFVESLREHGAADTWICFVSDHGEMVGDHHFFRKELPYQGSVSIPFLLRPPPGSDVWKRLRAMRAGEVGTLGAVTSDAVVELRDVMPTLLDAAGLKIPAGIDGKSLLPLLTDPAAGVRDFLHGEHTYRNGAVHWITDGQWKYIWYSADGYEQLFDLDSDPAECRDQASNETEQTSHYREVLIGELVGRDEGLTDGKRLIPGRPVATCLSVIDSFNPVDG